MTEAATVETMPGVRLALRVARDLSGADGATVRELLGHKGQPWMAHVDDFVARGRDGVVDGLEWRIHLAESKGRPVSSVCTWENRGVGILGHVYTRPEARRKGIARALMSWMLEGMRARGVRAMALNCEPDSHQAELYRALGFEPVPGAPGSMVQRFPAPPSDGTESLVVAPFAWGDWPHLNLFMLRGDLPRVRWAAMDLAGPCSVEHAALAMRFADRPARVAVLKCRASGIVRGVASVARRGDEAVVDFVCDVDVMPFRRVLLDAVQPELEAELAWFVDPADEAAVRPAAFGFVARGDASADGARRWARWNR